MTKRPPVDVWFIMVRMLDGAWRRIGERYLKKETAKGWRPFVKKCWRGLPTKVRRCRITFGEDGKPDAKTAERLDKEFNCDV